MAGLSSSTRETRPACGESVCRQSADITISGEDSCPGGHLFVPMYQLASSMKRGEVKERRVRCTHKNAPVLDTTFRLSVN